MQFESIRDNSFINPNVVILPRVAYQDIYRGLYDFNINLVSPRSPRAASNSIPQNTLISQESISNYNYTPASAPSFTSSYIGASNLSGFYNNTPNSYTSDRGTTTEADNYIYEDLSTRLESVLAKNTNIYTNREEIDVPSSRSFITPIEKFDSQKSEKSRELAKERQEKERIRIQKRQVLQRRMEQEQAARERQRQQQAMNIRRKREMDLRNQLRRQQQALQRQ